MVKPVTSSHKHALLTMLLAACALLCAGCTMLEFPLRSKIVKESQHANGLVVGVPAGYKASKTADGFVVEPSGNHNQEVRRPIIANVSRAEGDAPDESSLQTKTIGGRDVRYSVTKSEGGSDGEVYALNVFERVPGGHIKYSQATQSDSGEPDFALCWVLVGSTKYRDSR